MPHIVSFYCALSDKGVCVYFTKKANLLDDNSSYHENQYTFGYDLG